METRANRLPMVLAVIVLAIGVVVWFRACTGGEGADPRAETEVPKAPPPDADSPAASVRTLTAKVGEMQSTFKAMTNENERLLDENEHLKDRIDKLQHDQSAQESAAEKKESVIDRMTSRLDSLTGQLASLKSDRQSESDLPADLGLDKAKPPESLERIVWTPPVDVSQTQLAKLSEAADAQFEQRLDDGAPRSARRGGQRAPGLPPELGPGELAEPRYTIPENTVLTASTAFTALVGRIPRQGRVIDPFPFYILVSEENLAANGHELPEVTGIIFRGEAFGDFNLQCVRGDLVSATFVFDDGTIRTIDAEGDPEGDAEETVASGGDGDDDGEASGRDQGANERLGSIADPVGIPCVSGRLITDAPAFLARRTLVSGVGAAGDAAAAASTTRIISPFGSTTRSTDPGDVGRFIIGETIADTSDDIEQFLDERYDASFDAIFVPPAHRVSLLIQREMAIDYEPNGRKLRHDRLELAPGGTGLD